MRGLAIVTLALSLTACGNADEPDDASGPGSDPTAVDASLVRDDVDCTLEGLDPSDEFDFTTAHYVVDGALGAPCLGEEDPDLINAWEVLASVAPAGQLADLALFGGFSGSAADDEPTLAFVNTLDDEGSVFQMSVNLGESADPDELALTMVHEFSHVFTGLSTQLDRSLEPDECDTYDNGEGCYLADSLMFGWIEEFWGNGLIDRVDPDAEAGASVGQALCDLDPGFFGPYAASNPEEDFAETFSAWTLDVPVTSPERQARYDWLDGTPGLAEFRDRAREAERSVDTNTFETCG